MCRTVELMFRNFAKATQLEDGTWEARMELFSKVVGVGKTEKEARDHLDTLLKPIADKL